MSSPVTLTSPTLTSPTLTSNNAASHTFPVQDTVGAWLPHGRFVVPPTKSGPLDGLRFAAKDLYDVIGHTTGAGNPVWLATHTAATASSPIIDTLLNQGATLLGKVITDELAYSVHGDNIHYGTPHNPRAPGRVPGGSSSGSASAAAAGLCDFALGTDTGGSTRVPASYCGIWGLRTTHGLLDRTGLVPLSPAFDTATWLARQAAVFERVADVLLGTPAHPFRHALILDDACAEADALFLAPLARLQALLASRMPVSNARTSDVPLEQWRLNYITASAHDAWATQGSWIRQQAANFAPPIAARWQMAARISDADAASAMARIKQWRDALRQRLGEDGIAVLPSASGVAPTLDASAADIEDVRARTFRLTSIAGIAGLPQVSIPLLLDDGLPIGLSLIGPAGSDRALIALAVTLGRELGSPG